MAKARETHPAETVRPAYAEVAMAQVIAPKLPSRATMSDNDMRSLVDSMGALGLINPISVRKSKGKLEVIAGHRRFLAALSLKWEKIRAFIYPEGYKGTLAVRFHENAIRESLNPAEEALWMRQAQEELGLDEAGLCELFKCSEDYLAGRFALLRGDVEVFNCLQRAEIRIGVAHELNRITDEGMRRYYLDVARKSDPAKNIVRQWVEDWKLRSGEPAPAAGQAGLAAGALASGPNGDNGSPPPGATAGDIPATYQNPLVSCALCGGHRDPYNLVNVFIHKHELNQILLSIERASKGLTENE